MSQSKNKQQPKRGKKQQPWLLIVLLAGGLTLVFVAVVAFNNPTASGSGVARDGSSDPRLFVDKESVDLGNVKFNQTVEVVFKLTNEGDKTLMFNQEPYVELLEGC